MRPAYRPGEVRPQPSHRSCYTPLCGEQGPRIIFVGIRVFLRKKTGARVLRPPSSERGRPVPAPLPRDRRVLLAVGGQGGLGPQMRHKATTHTPHVGPLHDLHRVARMVGFETPPVPARRLAGAVVPGPSPPGAHYTPPPGFTHQPESLPALSTPSLSAVAHAASGGRRSRHQGALCSTLPLGRTSVHTHTPRTLPQVVARG